MPRAREAIEIAILVSVLGLAATPAGAEGREHLGRGIARDGDRLVIADPAGDVTVDLEGWQPLPDPPAGLVALRRHGATGGELRLLDRRGRAIGTIEVPSGWTGFATDAGVVLVPQALHAPRRPHWLRFLSHAGEPRAEVREPGLALVSWVVAPGGGVATVSERVEEDPGWVVHGYDRLGATTWRHEVAGPSPPEALLAAGGQLVVLERDVDAGVSTLTILVHGRAPKSHRLANVTDVAADPDSSRVAAVGQETVALFDARTGKLLWQRDEPLDFVLHGGLRFDRRSARLLVVNAERDRSAGKARLGLRGYRVSDGSQERASLGVAPMGELPTVVDVETSPAGGRRVLLHDRAVTATPDGPMP